MNNALRRKILRTSQANMTFTERWRIGLTQVWRNLCQLAGYLWLLFGIGLLLFVYLLLRRHSDPFSDSLTWNIWFNVVLSMAYIGFSGTLVFVNGVQPYLPLDDRRWLVSNAIRQCVLVLLASVLTILAVTAALSKSLLPWYSIGYIAFATALGQSALILLLPTQKSIGIRLRNLIANRVGAWFWLGLLFSMIALLFLPERYWPEFSYVRLVAGILPPTWPTLLVGHLDQLGATRLLGALSFVAVICSGLVVLKTQRNINAQSLWDLYFNDFPGSGPTIHPGAWAYFLTAEEQAQVAIPESSIAEFDAKRSSAEEQIEQYYLENHREIADPPLATMSATSQGPTRLFQSLIKSALSAEEMRMLHVARANTTKPFKLLDLILPQYIAKVVVVFLFAILLPKWLLVLAIIPATLLVNLQILPHVLYIHLEKVQWLPIDPRVLLRAETKYRLLCAIPIFFSCLLINVAYITSVEIDASQYLFTAMKLGLGFVIVLPAVLVLSFVGSLKCPWARFSELKFALAVGLGLVVGITGLGAFVFFDFGVAFFGAVVAMCASAWLWQTCIAWYETGPTDIAV